MSACRIQLNCRRLWRALVALTTSAGMLGPAMAQQRPTTIDEPAVSGRVVDARTGQPVVGAFVFGYYALGRGTLGGGFTVVGANRRFAVLTDAEGVFRLSAWRSQQPMVGERRERFPVVAIFKPGYRTQLKGLNSIAQWHPNAGDVQMRAPVTAGPGTIDWTRTPHALAPAESNPLRYVDLQAAGMAIDLSGACAWETYAPVLQAMHDDLKDLIRRTVSPADLDNEGYLRSGIPHPLPHVDFLTRSYVDRLVALHRRDPASWLCADPGQVFRASHR